MGIGGLKRLFTELLHLFFPRCCNVCGTPLLEGERIICLSCRVKMPRILPGDTNLLDKLTSTHIRIERAASMMKYNRHTPYSRLIQNAKYNGMSHIARSLAHDFANELLPEGFFEGITAIVPVPLSTAKMRKRGYNQAERIATGISEATGIPVRDCLVAKSHSTQTRLGRSKRRHNVAHTFGVDSEEIAGLRQGHVLIVDDVITTGATMLECAATLSGAIHGVRVSVLSLASSSAD